jgi:hypothetical protein
MPRENYQSAGELVRNIADLPTPVEVLETHGKFRIVRVRPPYYSGSELWVVNEKGFFWEPIASVDAGRAYLQSGDQE